MRAGWLTPSALVVGAALLTGIPGARAQEILTSKAPDRAQQLLDGARKEGQVVLYSAAIVNQALRPIALNIFAHHPLISKAKGAPVNTQLLGPVPSTAGTMVVPRGVRHPYAAMLLADFIISKEGQSIFAKAEYFPVRPDVAPLETLAPVVPKVAGVEELFVSSEKLNRLYESSQKVFEDKFRQ